MFTNRYLNYSSNLVIPVFKQYALKSFHFPLLIFFVAIFFNNNRAVAQIKRMVAIGSSTTAGFGATTKGSCWVGLLNNYYKCSLDVIDSAYNLGVIGSNNYNGMPTTYVPPASRPNPDAVHNVSKAILLLANLPNANDGVVIVNFPTNNYITYSIAEIMSSLQVIYDSVTARGNRCYITTTQPRNDLNFNTSAVKKKLADIKDSIISRFNDNSLNFWDGMYNPADTTILEKYSYGDNVHFNNAGHRVLFERVLTKNIFNLPVWYSKATGYLDNLSAWGSNTDGTGTSPTSFTADNQLFNIVNNPSPSIEGDWMLSGKNTQLIIGDGITPVNFTIPADRKIIINSTRTMSCY